MDPQATPPKKTKTVKRDQKYRPVWENELQFKGWLTGVKTDQLKAMCKICNVQIKSEKQVLINHVSSKKHNEILASKKKTPQGSIASMFQKMEPRKHKVKAAELQLASFFVEHNISFKAADHLVEIMRKNFSECDPAKNLTLGRTKCSSIVKNAIGPHFKEKLINKLKQCKFSIMVDESPDISSEKAMCILVRYCDNEIGQIVSRFLDLVNIYSNKSGDVSQGATAENLCNCIVNTLEKYEIPNHNVIGFASDGCNTMMGMHNSVASRFRNTFPGIVIMKCVCHSLHLCASEACKALPQELEDLEESITF